MSSTPKSRKPRAKAPRGRPAATSGIAQPVVADSSSETRLSAFSPDGNLFALLSLAIDKSQLRVYDTNSRQCVAEHLVDSGRVTVLSWARFDLEGKSGKEEGDAVQPKKKRKKRASMAVDEPTPAPAAQLYVMLGISDGSLVLFSPNYGRTVRTLSHTASGAAVSSISIGPAEDGQPTALWASSSDSKVHLWDVSRGTLLGTWSSDDRISYTSLSARPTAGSEDVASVLAAHHSIRLLSVPVGSSSQIGEAQKAKTLANFTGHASTVKDLQWCGDSRFVSIAHADRFVQVWDLPSTLPGEGRMASSIPLDAYARCISLSDSSVTGEKALLAVSASGKIVIFTVPAMEGSSSDNLLTLEPKSTISVSSKDISATVEVISASFAAQKGQVRIARLVNGVQPAFSVATYLDELDEYITEVVVADAAAGLATGPDDFSGAQTRRYNEAASLAVRSGVELGHDASMDDVPMRDVDGELDAELAELSLGQRLTALNGDARASSDENDDAVGLPSKAAPSNAVQAVPANSLTRTLIQALHSSDAGLLETCLAHSDAALIRNTVRRLPPQLAVPLITACVERLGRGARGANVKGGGGGASSQRGAALVQWVKAALTTHSGHLMTMPDLLARLSGLHATLTMRLALQQSLLELSGRLDMVVSQIEMRSTGAPAPLPVVNGKKGKGKAPEKEARRYVEGESEAEDEAMEEDVNVESGDDEGSVEDIELGGSDEDEDEEEEEEEDEEETDDEDDEEGPRINGFIDDEAEEYSEEDEDESE